MIREEVHKKGVEALKLLNNAVTTSRLYPSEAPQVANAIEHGYTGIKHFLESHSLLEFSLKNNSFLLCGETLSQEVLDSFPNLVIYRQLRLLETSRLLMDDSMDRFAFGQVLNVLTASAEKVKKAGGGKLFITSLGLKDFFPVEQQAGSRQTIAASADTADSGAKASKQVKVRPELIASLLGKDDRPLIVEELHEKMADPEQCVQIIAAGIGKILQGIRQKNKIISTPFFQQLMQNAENLIDENQKKDVAKNLAGFLALSLKESALCVLLSQEFSDKFSTIVYENLIGALPAEKLGAVIIVFREQIAKNNKPKGDQQQVEFFGGVMNRLIQSEKGKQYLSTEKARSIIQGGEKERTKKRLEAGIRNLLAGRVEVLQNEEVLRYLPGAVRQMLRGENRPYVEGILSNLQNRMTQTYGQDRARVVESLVAIGEKLIEDEEFELLDSAIEILVGETKRPDTPEELFERNVTLLHGTMQSHWQRKEYKKGDTILNFFYQMRSKAIERPEHLRAIVGKVQDSNINRNILPELLADCLADPDNETLRYRIVLQGPVAIRFMVEKLISAEQSGERLVIIDILTTVGTFIPVVVRERLQGHMPWFGKRNLLKLLGETGSEDDADEAIQYLQHNDFRVQREAFLCIYRIGGRRRKEIFLSVIEECPPLIQHQIVEAFAGFCDKDIALKLGELLAKSEKLSGDREKLVLAILSTLERCPFEEAQQSLEQFLAAKGQRANREISSQVWEAAEKTLDHLKVEIKEAKKRHIHASQIRKNALIAAANVKRAVGNTRSITGLPQEQSVRNLLAKDDVKGAGELLLDLIGKTAKSQNIVQAEQLRDWLVRISSGDVAMSLKALDIIDKVKQHKVADQHQEIWSELYDNLSTEEFKELFESLIHESFQPDDIIVAQGALQRSLFFINSGKLKLYFTEKAGEVLVKTVGKGEPFGADVFFDASIWTISVGCLEAAEVSVLRYDRLLKWRQSMPDLESKLLQFCSRFESIAEIMKSFVKDRRRYERKRLKGKAKTILLDSRKRRIGYPEEIELVDISVGGISYRGLSRSHESARALLGHCLQIDLAIDAEELQFLEKDGDIIALKVSPQDQGYSVHVKFRKELSSAEVKAILRCYTS